jgi:hypothetical protein
MSTHIDAQGRTIDDATGAVVSTASKSGGAPAYIDPASKVPANETADPSGVEPIQVRKSRLAEENRQRGGVVHSSANRAKVGIHETTAEELTQDRKARGLQP